MLTRGPSCVPTDCFRRSVFGCTSRAGEHGGLPPDVAKTKNGGLTSTQSIVYTNDNTMARLHSETSLPRIPTPPGAPSAAPTPPMGWRRVKPSGGAVNTTTASTALRNHKSKSLTRKRKFSGSESASYECDVVN